MFWYSQLSLSIQISILFEKCSNLSAPFRVDPDLLWRFEAASALGNLTSDLDDFSTDATKRIEGAETELDALGGKVEGRGDLPNLAIFLT